MAYVPGLFRRNATAGAAVRLQYDASNYVDFDVSSGGDLVISPTGSAVTVGGTMQGTTANGYLHLQGDSGATRGVRVKDDGNVSVGTEDIEAWQSAYGALQLGQGAAIMYGVTTRSITLLDNAYFDGAYKYRTTNAATRYGQSGGQHLFYVAPSGTIDTAITWTTALTINNSGYLIPNLPTSDPSVSGALWNDSGTVKVSP